MGVLYVYLYMNTFTKIGLSIASILLLTSSVGSIAHAQTTTSSSMAIPMCYAFTTNIRYGTDDAYTGQSTVAQLQQFLAAQGDFNSAYLGTGHFGPLTLSAVQKYQSDHAIPATGFVGPLTRASINSSCGTTTPPQTSPVSIYSISPTSAAAGDTLNIRGFGFTSSNTVLLDGNVAAQNVPISSSIAIACTTSPSCHGGINQTLTITVPTSLAPNCTPGMMCAQYMRLVTPGTYTVTVQNSNGTSNPVTLTITGTPIQPSSQTLSVTGLDAPSSLTTNQTGTWTVHAITNTGSGNLHYSVVWGDEHSGAYAIMAPSSYPTTTTSATFTHQYTNTGTYTPVFTVTDDAGHSVTTRNTITVTTPIYY